MTRLWSRILLAMTMLGASGCNLNSFFDPSRTGRFEYTPTTIPILERIDVIEHEGDPWAVAAGPIPDDLVPGDLTYRIAPGDFISIEIFELLLQGQVWNTTRRVSAGGEFRLPAPLGDVRAGGLTVQEFQDEVTRLVHEQVMPDPLVNITVEESAGFTYTVYGAVVGTGLYALRSADFRLLDALAQAGGVALVTEKVYVIRQVPLTEQVIVEPSDRYRQPTSTPDRTPVDIEDLIRQLDEPETAPLPPLTPPPATMPAIPADDEPMQQQPAGQAPPQHPPIDIEDLIKDLDPDPDPDLRGESSPGGVAPAAFAQPGGPLIDIDDLQPARMTPPPGRRPVAPRQPAAKAVSLPAPQAGETYIYLQETDEWVPVSSVRPERDGAGEPTPAPLFVQRIIRIDYQKLKRGMSNFNVIIRPGDQIYVQEPQSGVVYVDGEILRPGVYNFPANGKMTLSRLVAAAGGPGPLSIPTRVDLTRVVGENREATIRLNLAAIRNRTEPDIYLRPDDHIILGTNFWATPLAVFRNALRITYGFGFLLDRNFGNDVFGPPPINIVR